RRPMILSGPFRPAPHGGVRRGKMGDSSAEARGVGSTMADVLAEIVAHKKLEIASAKQRVPEEELRERARSVEAPRNFFTTLTRPKHDLRVIAEVKKASPSAGLIREDFDPVAIATAYYEN